MGFGPAAVKHSPHFREPPRPQCHEEWPDSIGHWLREAVRVRIRIRTIADHPPLCQTAGIRSATGNDDWFSHVAGFPAGVVVSTARE